MFTQMKYTAINQKVLIHAMLVKLENIMQTVKATYCMISFMSQIGKFHRDAVVALV